MRYALNIEKETGRILSATFLQYASIDAAIVDILPEGNIADYLYKDNEYIYDPLPVIESPEESSATLEERVSALEESLTVTKILMGVE